MKNEVTTAAHIRALFQAMRERKEVALPFHALYCRGGLVIQRINLDGEVDLYDRSINEIVQMDVNPDNVKILE